MARRMQKDSIFQIARDANVSIATVSRVINRRPGVSESVRRMISKMLEERNFSPNYPVPSLMNIAIALPHEAIATGISNYLSRLLCGISMQSAESNVNPCMIFYREEEKHSLLEQMREHQAAGALLILSDLFESQLEELSSSGLPLITIDGNFGDERIGYVDNDCESGISEAIDHLKKLGHTHIGYLVNQTDLHNHAERIACYNKCMTKAGLRPLVTDFGRVASYEAIESGLLRLLKEKPETTAMLIIGDTYAPIFLHACRNIGLSVPEDMSVIGFDNATDSPYFFPPLTTIDHPIEDESRIAIEGLALAVAQRKTDALPRIKLQTKLIVRDSTSNPRCGKLQLNNVHRTYKGK